MKYSQDQIDFQYHRPCLSLKRGKMRFDFTFSESVSHYCLEISHYIPSNANNPADIKSGSVGVHRWCLADIPVATDVTRYAVLGQM